MFFWARLSSIITTGSTPVPVMNDLNHCGEKITLSSHQTEKRHFELCGFDPTKIYEIEGNWFTMQCARCHDTSIQV